MDPAADAPDLPPFDAAAEASVVGCALLLPEESLPLIVERNAQDDCYELRHRTILEMLIDMSEANDSIDTVTVAKALRSRHQLQGIGGIEYLTQLQDTVPSQAHLPAWLDIVQEKALLRKMIQVGSNIALAATDASGDPEAILDEAETAVLAIRQQRTVTGSRGIKQLMRDAVTFSEECHVRQGQPFGISTGFVDLDKLTHGLRGGQYVMLAARPSEGKSSLAMNIVENVAVTQGLPVGVFSLEMTEQELSLRLLYSRAKVSLTRMQEGELVEGDFPIITNAAKRIGQSPVYLDDTSGISVLQLRARARRMKQQYGIQLLVIDYLQLLHSTNKKCRNRQEEVADISKGIKELAKDLNIPVIVLGQLNRDVDKDKKHRKPRLSDLRESGSIEADADIVLLLYKQPAEDPEKPEGDEIPVDVLLVKQRNGPTGVVHLTFTKSCTRFDSVTHYSDDKYGN